MESGPYWHGGYGLIYQRIVSFNVTKPVQYLLASTLKNSSIWIQGELTIWRVVCTGTAWISWISDRLIIMSSL